MSDLKKAERKKYKEMFKLFDVNGDGTLSVDEFRLALDKIGYCLCEDYLQVSRHALLMDSLYSTGF